MFIIKQILFVVYLIIFMHINIVILYFKICRGSSLKGYSVLKEQGYFFKFSFEDKAYKINLDPSEFQEYLIWAKLALLWFSTKLPE